MENLKSIYDEDYIEIITRLRVIRTNKQITQLELANKMGKAQSFISKIENCERRLDVIEFLRWIDALNICFSDIIPIKYTKEGL
ncbi:helix-turn-helix domain-containing protein [Streptococcus suis]|uniref:helix-turn-helix domain-containing protein n=1 Tax=Streptococcus suis TaxID=1307 RepID=UPI003B28B784